MVNTAPIETRFWSKVDRRSPSECWNWLATKDRHGYGHVRHEGVTWQAHRVSWLLANGQRPAACVCHSCDNPSCVNPDHLWVGTQSDNLKDMAAKGRHGMTRKANQRSAA